MMATIHEKIAGQNVIIIGLLEQLVVLAGGRVKKPKPAELDQPREPR